MATRRSEIQVVVTGLDDVRSLNTALNRHATLIEQVRQRYGALGTSLAQPYNQAATAVQTLNTQLLQVNQTSAQLRTGLTNIGAAANSANGSARGLLGTFLQYRALSLVFQGIVQGIHQGVEALKEMELQASRTSRVFAEGSDAKPLIRAGIAEEVTRTGASIKDTGEAYYQLGTFLKDDAQRFSALQTAMNLVVGTQADARDTSRAMIQIYEQFGDQLDKTTTKAETMRRIGELLAITYRDAAAEMSEITNALKYLGPIAEAAKIPLAQVTGVITALTAEGHRGRMAGTEVAQFISQLVKNYNAELGGIQKGDLVYHFKLVRDKDTGGVDLEKTLQSVIQMAKTLPEAEAEKFLRTIGGTQNAFRFLGTQGDQTLTLIHDEIEKANSALKGQTNEAEKLRIQMTTTAQEFQRVWLGAISAISNMIDASGLKKFLHDTADQMERLRQIDLGIQQGHSVESRITTGQGAFPGSLNARQQQLLQQRAILSGIYETGQDFYGRDFSQNNKRYPEFRDRLKDIIDAPAAAAVAAPFVKNTDKLGIFYDVNFPAIKAEMEKLDASLKSLRTVTSPAATGRGVKLSPDQIADYARKAGFSEQQIPMAVAIALAESSGDPRQISRNNDRFHTKDRGLFQINDLWHNEVTDAQAFDPLQNAKAAYGISLGGTNWNQWTTFKTGAFRKYLNATTSGKGPAITKSPEAIEQERREMERERQKLEKARQEALKAAADDANTDFEILLNSVGSHDKRTIQAAVEAYRTAYAAADKNTRKRMAAGQEGPIYELTHFKQVKQEKDTAEQKRLEELKRAAGFARNQYDLTERQLGASDPNTIFAAEIAQAKAVLAETDPVQKQRLRTRLEGPAVEAQKAAQQAMREAQKSAVSGIEDALNTNLRDIGRSERPSLIYGDADTRRQQVLTSSITQITDAIDKLNSIDKPTEETTRQIADMGEKLKDAQSALQDFKDSLQSKSLDKLISDISNKYSLALDQIEAKIPLSTERDQTERERAILAARAAATQRYSSNINDFASTLNFFGLNPDKVKKLQEDADIARRKDQSALTRFDTQKAIDKYNSVADEVRNATNGGVKNFLTGKGTVADAAKGIGDTVVNSVLDEQIKKWTDPFVATMSSQILAVEGNTDALRILTGAMNGYKQGATANAPDDPSSNQAKSKALARRDSSKLNTTLAQGFAGYSLFASGQQQGSTLGSVLGGAATGFALGGPVGAAVGGALNLIGGLFHHKSEQQLNKERNPALYNAPSDFEYYAYRYRVTGTLPTQAEAGRFQTAAPTVNVYVDGVKTAVKTELGTQTQLGRVAQTNAYYDTRRPI